MPSSESPHITPRSLLERSPKDAACSQDSKKMCSQEGVGLFFVVLPLLGFMRKIGGVPGLNPPTMTSTIACAELHHEDGRPGDFRLDLREVLLQLLLVVGHADPLAACGRNSPGVARSEITKTRNGGGQSRWTKVAQTTRSCPS